MSTDLDQPMQGEGVLTARSFTNCNGFGSRYLDHTGTCPKDGVSYYVVYLNHTYNIPPKTQKVKKNIKLFYCTILSLLHKSLYINDLGHSRPGRISLTP